MAEAETLLESYGLSLNLEGLGDIPQLCPWWYLRIVYMMSESC